MPRVESRSPSLPVFATISQVVCKAPEVATSLSEAPSASDRFVSRWNTVPGQATGAADLRALGKLMRSDLDKLILLSDATGVQTVPQLQSRLEQIVDVFSRRGDLRGLFPSIYAPTTARAWEARLAGKVGDTTTSDALALDFGKRFLDNLRAHLTGAPTTPSWAHYFEQTLSATEPSFSLIAQGMNAHLTVDLPAAIAQTDVPRSFHADFLELGDAMAAGIPQMSANVKKHYGLEIADLLQGYQPGRMLSAIFGPDLPSRITFQELREIAWQQGQALRAGDLEAAHGLVDNESSYRARKLVIDHLPM